MSGGPRKPIEGAPCNGCGLCCVAEPCPIALDYVDGIEPGQPCPALQWEDGRAWCGMIRTPSVFLLGEPNDLFDLAIGRTVQAKLGGDSPGTCDAVPGVGMTAADFFNFRSLTGKEPE